MTNKEHNWKRAPVVEVVLGIQFQEIPKLSNAHLGLFWQSIRDQFPLVDDVPPIGSAVEQFGDDLQFGIPGFAIGRATGGSRLRMVSPNQSEMIQLQNGWIVANWTKSEGSNYQGYTRVRSIFTEIYSKFSAFLQSQHLGKINPIVWEVTYIDHIPKNTVWNCPGDVRQIFPGLFSEITTDFASLEAIDCTWTWKLSPLPGRLRISVQSARSVLPDGEDILYVRSLARGAVTTDNNLSAEDFLNFGRDSVVSTFTKMASPAALSFWKGEVQ